MPSSSNSLDPDFDQFNTIPPSLDLYTSEGTGMAKKIFFELGSLHFLTLFLIIF